MTPINYQDGSGDVLWGTGAGENNFTFPNTGMDHALVATPDTGVGFAFATIQGASVRDEFNVFYLRCEASSGST